MAANRHWTATEMASLRQVWGDPAWSRRQIAAALRRSMGSVSNMACRLCLGVRPAEVTRGSGTRKAAQVLHAARGTQPRRPHKVPTPPAVVDRLGHARVLLRRGIAMDTVARGLRLSDAERAVLREVA